jgi:hypothetical protein
MFEQENLFAIANADGRLRVFVLVPLLFFSADTDNCTGEE